MCVVQQVVVALELEHDPGVAAGVGPLHPPEHHSLQLQILASYCLQKHVRDQITCTESDPLITDPLVTFI